MAGNYCCMAFHYTVSRFSLLFSAQGSVSKFLSVVIMLVWSSEHAVEIRLMEQQNNFNRIAPLAHRHTLTIDFIRNSCKFMQLSSHSCGSHAVHKIMQNQVKSCSLHYNIRKGKKGKNVISVTQCLVDKNS